MAVTQAVQGQADEIRNTADAQYSSIRNDSRRSVSGIASAIAQVYLDAKTAMDALSTKTGTDTSAEQRQLTQAAFGLNVSGTPAEIAAASMSYRDAQDRVADIDNPQTALQLMSRANDSNDDLLAKALAQVAWNWGVFGGAGWGDVIDAYVDTRPQAARALAALGDFSSQQRGFDASDIFAFALPKPMELQSYPSDYQLAELAAGG